MIRTAARKSKAPAPPPATTMEPWNEATLADLQQRKAAKFFLLVSEESARTMAETGLVPLGVQAQCQHLLAIYDGKAD